MPKNIEEFDIHVLEMYVPYWMYINKQRLVDFIDFKIINRCFENY